MNTTYAIANYKSINFNTYAEQYYSRDCFIYLVKQ